MLKMKIMNLTALLILSRKVLVMTFPKMANLLPGGGNAQWSCDKVFMPISCRMRRAAGFARASFEKLLKKTGLRSILSSGWKWMFYVVTKFVPMPFFIFRLI